MKFVGFALVAVVACLVDQVVFGQPTTEEDSGCISPDVDLRNVAKQTTLNDVAQAIKELKDSVTFKPCTESSPLLNTNQIMLLKSKTAYLISYLMWL